MWQGTTGYHSSCELWTGATPIDSKILLLILSFGSYHKIFIEVCPEKVQPSLIQWELFVWHQCNLATRKRVLECACVNNDNFTVLVSGAVDAVDCVLCGCYIQNDWTSWAMNLHQILHWAWTFLRKNYSDDSEGHSYGQLVIGGCIMTMCPLTHHISFRVFGALQARFSALWILIFPKLILPWKGKRFQTVNEIQENMMGQLMVIGRTVWGSKVSALKGTEASLSYVQCFLYIVSSPINVSFSYYVAGYLLDRCCMAAKMFWSDISLEVISHYGFTQFLS